MSGEKTHSATPKRRQEARKKGQVRKSAELSSGLLFLGLTLLLKSWLPSILDSLNQLLRDFLQRPANGDLTMLEVQRIFLDLAMVFAKILMPICVGAVVLGILVNYFQVGTLFTLKPLNPDLQRINPLAGFQRLFSIRTLLELVKSLLKMTILGYMTYQLVVSDLQSAMTELQSSSWQQSISLLASILSSFTWKAALVFIVLGVGDYLYQWWEYERSLKMSHQELKEEHKSTEGNPQIKGEIRRKQRAMAMRRMMQDVPKADFVVTNPTHFAVAVKYDPKSMRAPIVVAKGQDEVAKRIKGVAEEHQVPLFENPPLARSLYRSVEIGQPVPQELYKAVAEVLAFVYRLNKRKKTS